MTQTHEVPRLLRAAYFAMHRVSDAHFASQGITADQFVLLACLAEQNAVMQQDLVRRAASDPSTIRAMLVLLEGRGLVVRERHPADGRARKVSLTTKGRRWYERLWTTSAPIRTQLLAGFSTDEAESLLDFLSRIIENMGLMNKSPGRDHSNRAAALGGAPSMSAFGYAKRGQRKRPAQPGPLSHHAARHAVHEPGVVPHGSHGRRSQALWR